MATWTSIGPMSSGRNVPRPPPSIIAGPPIPMLLSAVAITVSQQPSRAALPAKHRPAAMPDRGHQPGEPGEVLEGAGVEPGDHRHVRVAGPAPAALGEEHHRQPEPLDQLEDAVLLGVVALALGPGEHRVVVGDHRAPGPVLGHQVAVDPPDAR